jgi:type I restriction enzyme S subunit
MSLPRYPSYKESGVQWLGEVPAHWVVKPNKSFLAPCKTAVGETWSEKTLLSLTLNGVIPRDTESGKGKYPAEFTTYKDVAQDDVVFCLFDIDETPRTVGLARESGMITGAYDVFRCKEGAIPSFVYYYYLHIDSFKGLRPFYTGLRKVVRPPTFLAINVPLPPASEQNLISIFLDRETAKIDALVAEQQRLIELLKEKRQAVISHAVTKGLNPNAPMKPSGIQWLGNVPAHWEVCLLKRAFRSVDYGISDSLDSDGAVAILRMGNIEDGKVVTADLKYTDSVDAGLLLQKGDLLYNRTNSLDLIGKVGMFLGNGDTPVSFASYLVRLRTVEESLPEYFAYLLNTTGILGLARSNAFVAIGQCNLNPTRYGQITVAIPPRDEQAAIVSHLDIQTAKLDTLTTEAQRAIDLLQERRTALISAAVTGQIDVRGLVQAEAA